MMQGNQNCSSPLPTDIPTSNTTKAIFDLLTEGLKKTCNEYGIENATLIIGNTGAGKSTFTQRIAGRQSALYAKKIGDHFHMFKIGSDAIHENSVLSTTIFPELIINNKTGAAFYDFPGFKDTRGVAYDIVIIFFIKKILSNVKRVKMIFMIDYNSITGQASRDGFISFLEHISKLVKNLDKFRSSIALMVSKVPPDNQNSDDERIQSIVVNNMKSLKNVVQKSRLPMDSNAMKLLDLLLQPIKSCRRIGLSLSPGKEGWLNEMPLLEENTANIEAMLDKLDFIEVSNYDFGYFIPRQSLIEINKMIYEVNRNISYNVEKGGEEIIKFLSTKEHEVYDIFMLRNKTTSLYDDLLSMRERADKYIDPKNCVQELIDSVLPINSSPNVFQSFSLALKYGAFSSFLQTVSDHSTIVSFKCSEGLDNAIKFSLNSKHWYVFLTRLFGRLSEYNVQKNNDEKSLCMALANKVAQCISNEICSIEELLPFLQKCYPKYDYRVYGISNMILDKSKLNALLRTLNSTLKHSLDINSCESNKLIIKGKYIELRDVQKAIVEKCKNMSPKFVNVFALNKVFLNTDLNLKDYQVQQLSIIAPVWDIQSAPKITLNDGPDHTFFGIGDTFINANQLVISVNHGQDSSEKNRDYGKSIFHVDGIATENYIYIIPIKEESVDHGIRNFGEFEAVIAHTGLYVEVNDYKSYLRENLSRNIRETPLLEFLNELESNKLIRQLYNVSGLLNSLKYLESQYHKLHKDVQFLPFYQSLLSRAEELIAKNDGIALENSEVLHYVCIAALSKICQIKYNLENYQVVDINGYFPSAETHISEYKNALQEVKIDTRRSQYQSIVNEEIHEAHKLIEQSIMPEIDDIFKKIDIQVQSLFKIINEQIKQAENEKKDLIIEKNELAKQLPFKALIGVLKTASTCFNFLGNAGLVAGAAAGLTLGTVESTMFNDGKKATALAQSLTTTTTTLMNNLKDEQQFIKEMLEEELNNAPREAFAGDDQFESISKVVKSLGGFNKTLTSQTTYLNIKDKAMAELKFFREKYSKEKSELLIKKSSNTITNFDQQFKSCETKIKWMMHLERTMNVASAGVGAILDYKNNKNLISIIGDSVKLADTKIQMIKTYEQDIRNIFLPKIQYTEERLFRMLESSSDKSHAVLDIKKWEVGKFLKDFRAQMKYMMDGLPGNYVKEQITRCVDKLHDGMMTGLQIFDRVQDYQDRAKLADYIADLNSGPKKTDNPILNQELNYLEMLIKSNLVLQDYEKVLATFKQYIFPFANLYLDQFHAASLVRSNTISDLVNMAVEKIGKLRIVLQTESTSIVPHNFHRYSNLRYDFANVHQKPFFTWKYDTYKNDIKKLLQGQEITLKADITKGLRLSAVKFTEIGIRFRLKDEKIQNELDKRLVNFLVNLAHVGDSSYRCNTKYYIFHHNVISMQHTVTTINDSLSQPHYDYMDYTSNLIKKNEPLFSPYATWRIKLEVRSEELNATYDELKQFLNETIDLTLEGRGGHIELKSQACDNNLEEHYKLDDTISQAYLNGNPESTSLQRKRRQIVMGNCENIEKCADEAAKNNKFQSSSANIFKSPINVAINDILESMKKFYLPQMMNLNLMKNGIQSMFGRMTQFKIHNTGHYDHQVTQSAGFNVNESLTLADFFIRWITKMKPYDNTEGNSINLLEVRASVLDIVEKFENVLSDLSVQYGLPKEALQHDPIVLISELEKVVINGNYKQLREIFLKSITNNSYFSDDALFKNVLNKFDEVLIDIEKFRNF